jgi:hypothetical protein
MGLGGASASAAGIPHAQHCLPVCGPSAFDARRKVGNAVLLIFYVSFPLQVVCSIVLAIVVLVANLCSFGSGSMKGSADQSMDEHGMALSIGEDDSHCQILGVLSSAAGAGLEDLTRERSDCRADTPNSALIRDLVVALDFRCVFPDLHFYHVTLSRNEEVHQWAY